MNFSDAEMAAVRQVMPHADVLTIRRHLQQRDALIAAEREARARRLAEALRQLREAQR